MTRPDTAGGGGVVQVVDDPAPVPDRSPDHARRRWVRALGTVAAVVVAAVTIAMLADHLAATLRAPADAARILELEKQVRDDAGVAETLDAERERQTNASLLRKRRNRAMAWVLLVAGSAGIACGKWWFDRKPPVQPQLDRLVADRFPAASVGVRSRNASDPVNAEPEHGDAEGFVADLAVRFGRGSDAAIPILQAIQAHYRYLPDAALERVCALTDIRPAQLAGTSSFYAQFRRSPVGRHVVRVCHGTACHVAGAGQITDELRRHLAIADGEDTDPRRLFTLDSVACLGCCSLAPVLMIGEDTAGRLSPSSARNVVDALEPSR